MKFNQDGITFVEMLVGAAVTGGVALLISQQVNTTQKVGKKVVNDLELTLAHAKIQSAFRDRATCTLTLRHLLSDARPKKIIKGMDDPLDYNSDPIPYPRIPPIFVEKQTLRGSITLDSLELKREGDKDFVEVIYDLGKGKNSPSNSRVIKQIPINKVVDTNGKVTCATERDDLNFQVKAEACKTAGGEYVNSVCRPVNLPPCIYVSGTMQCTPGYFLDSYLLVGESPTSLAKLGRCCRIQTTPAAPASPVVAASDVPVPGDNPVDLGGMSGGVDGLTSGATGGNPSDVLPTNDIVRDLWGGVGCVPPGGIDDTLYKTDCCSGAAVNGSTVCSNPGDYGTTWSSCTQICQ